MRFCFFLVLIVLTTFSIGKAQQAQIIKWNKLEELLHQSSDTTYVINFWASWCKGCVAELPYFINQEKQLFNKPVKFYFISLDFKKDFSTRLLPYLRKQNINSKVYLLDEPDYNSWIDKVDQRWGGGIPATLIYNTAKGKREMYEQEFSADELEQTLKKYIP